MHTSPYSIEAASIDSLMFGYIITNAEHEVLVMNQMARRLLAGTKTIKTLEEVVSRLPKRLELLDHVKYCSVEHKSCNFREVELGDRRVRVSLSPVFEGAELRGNALVLEDITERVAQDRARDDFLAFLVHEFRTPLTAIRGNSSLLEDFFKDALKDKDAHEIVADINTGSRSLLELVNQFLDMSRLEEGRIEFDLTPFDAVAMARETVKSLEVIAHDRGLTLELQADAPVMEVGADAGRAKQMLTNLIGNGLKFTEHGGVRVALTQRDEVLELRVSDTGNGIPEESRGGLFGKYFQAANNELRHDSSKSTGLGLYVTKLMTEGMGGTIGLETSVVGKGSTFLATLPLATPERLKQMAKQMYDSKQGVRHAEAFEHTLVAATGD
jgi:signal transduction histidine kinase